jgi:hypothetical protein
LFLYNSLPIFAANSKPILMKKYLVLIILFISSFISINFCYAQGVAVNTTGSVADPSAMLDVNATNKGILIPRVNSTSSITSPVVGLLIFQTTAPVGFYYYDGATWDFLQNSANVTLQGNTFNAANNLLKLDGAGKVPIANLGTSGTPSASTYLNGNDTWVPVPAGLINGTSAGQLYLTGSSPFSPQAPQTVTGDISISSTAVTTLASTGVGSGSYGSSTTIPIITVDSKGRVTAASTVAASTSFPSVITAPTPLTTITTSTSYQTMKSITLPSTGYYLVSAFINITTQQANDEYHAKITQGPIY